MSGKAKHPLIAKRKRSRGGVRGHLARRNQSLSEVMAELAVVQMPLSKDGHLRIPFRPNIPHKVRKQAFAVASAILGQRGGIARAKRLSAERRQQIARQGALARWGTGKEVR